MMYISEIAMFLLYVLFCTELEFSDININAMFLQYD